MLSKEFDLIVKTFQGLEEVLAKELTELGANNIEIQRRAVRCTGNLELLYKANFRLRTASRVLVPIAEFKAKDADEVYEQVKKINWDNYLSVDSTFAVDSTVYSEDFRHSKFVTYRVKDGIVDFFTEKTNKRPSVQLTNPDIQLNIHISHTTCTLSLDSSGESLHKRGYRSDQTEAPINEALAAGMILLTGWNGECDFIDPMCGSGTFLIEAALIALNIAPGIYRSQFAFEKWNNFDKELFEFIYNDDSHEREFNHRIMGSDSSARAVKIAETNVKSAGLSKHIALEMKPMQKLTPPAEKALLLFNPPYGERLQMDDLATLYQTIGRTLKHTFAGNTAWIISSSNDCMEHIGLRPSKRIHLLNGAIPCEFRRYDLFAGKREAHLAKNDRFV